MREAVKFAEAAFDESVSVFLSRREVLKPY